MNAKEKKTKMGNEDYKLARETQAAKELLAGVSELIADDPDMVPDIVEGETDLFEAVSSVVAAAHDDETLIKAISEAMADLLARQERVKRRVELRRALLQQALDIAGLRTMETVHGTVSVRKVPPKVVVMEEADIPAEYWMPAKPKLDRKALTAAAKDGKSIPGVQLSNGGETVAIRWK